MAIRVLSSRQSSSVTPGVDILCMDVPLFMRLLELSRETLNSDVQLHEVVTNVIAVSKTTDVMNIEDYKTIWPDHSSGGFESEDY